jgi:hypothetical protein
MWGLKGAIVHLKRLEYNIVRVREGFKVGLESDWN